MNVSEKENLFTYATKELSQDAFLMWVLSNYDDEGDVGRAAKKLLAEFCHLDNDEEIRNLTVRPQEGKIDISVYFDTNKREKLGLFIEDKTGSNEHNQLETYNDYIDKKLKETEITKAFRIFYKTGIFDDDELRRVKKAEWKIYGMKKEIHEMKEILNIWEEFENSQNVIIDMYVEHLNAINKIVNNKNPEIPDEYQGTSLSRFKWLAFFSNISSKKLSEIYSDKVEFMPTMTSTGGSYPILIMWYKRNKTDDLREKIAYLEISGRNFKFSSKDCSDVTFYATVQFPGGYRDIKDSKAASEYRWQIAKIIKENIDNGGKNFYQMKNIKRQLGRTKEISVKNTDDLIKKAKVVINAYIDLMEEVNKRGHIMKFLEEAEEEVKKEKAKEA